MSKLISNYATLVFDCDGVILNSNRIKTEAFRIAALPWGVAAADALVAYHVANGGISRHRKFAYFLETILPNLAPAVIPKDDGPGFDELLACYAQAVRGGLMTCEVAQRLEDLRAQTPESTWCIVSGGDQSELRDIFASRGLDHLFDGGIFGSPDSKDVILAREMGSGTLRAPGLFLGDSRYDYEAAKRAGLDFIFISKWTEVRDWNIFVDQRQLQATASLEDLLA
jgi:phosphoglycolate phosphatase-like HAD superfamily hydrolase